MSLKRSFHPLHGIEAFGPGVRGRLSNVSITTAEDFVGLYIADPDAVSDVINEDSPTIKNLFEAALGALDESTRQTLRQPMRRQGMGAEEP